MTSRAKAAAVFAGLATATVGAVAGVQLTGSSSGPCYTIGGTRSPAGVFRFNAAAKTTVKGRRVNFTVEHPCMTSGFVKLPDPAPKGLHP